MWSIASILAQRDGSNEMVRSSWFRSQTQNHYIWNFNLDLKLIFSIFENIIFQFSSKPRFLSHKFQDPSCRICSYGPHGPFWFSVTIHTWYGKTLPKQNKIWKFPFLRLSGKWINSSGVSFQKLAYVYEAPAGAFISGKLTFLEISDIPILEKLCISSYLGIFQMTPTATAPATTARWQLSHLTRPPSHRAQGWNIPFGNPSLRHRDFDTAIRVRTLSSIFVS